MLKSHIEELLNLLQIISLIRKWQCIQINLNLNPAIFII